MKGNIAVIGLVIGLPLALNLSKYFKVIGLINQKKLEQLDKN